MLLKLVEYNWAEHIDDALLLLGRLDTKTVPLAGGTYLLAQKDNTIQAVVDLRDLGLSYISEDTRYVHIGAMTTLQELVDAPLLKAFATGLLPQAALVSASSRLIRNCATVGGTLGAGVASQADLLTALVALGAEIVVRSGSKTQVSLSGGGAGRMGLPLSNVVYKGKQERRIACEHWSLEQRPNELIIEIAIPRVANSCGTSFMRISRTPSDVAMLNAAAVVEIAEGIYKRVRLAFGGANMEPVRLQAVEQQLEGQRAHPVDSQRLLSIVQNSMMAFRPSNDIRASSGYRRVSAKHLAYRVLEEATNVSHWRSTVASSMGRGL
ncbi:MAG: hypothetical protein E6J34_11605 [Chloroflexi bacterium]|nr:MAG: hypothetical protein E6J34_11605 [Chloroflexota bacterium]